MSGPISIKSEPASVCAIVYGVNPETAVFTCDSRGRDEVPAAYTRPRAVISHRDSQISAGNWTTPQKKRPIEMDRGLDEEDGGMSAGTSQRKSSLRAVSPPRTSGRCYLLELPPELRENIWLYAVTEWQSPVSEHVNEENIQDVLVLHKKPIRLDKWNRPGPPAITATCSQVRSETLHLYYQHNIFECWRPLFLDDGQDWRWSTFGDWITSLSRDRISWLRNVVLLYKHENELEHDIWWLLASEGIELREGVISDKRELSEYEMSFEALGLPRHFGKRRVWDRWAAGGGS